MTCMLVWLSMVIVLLCSNTGCNAAEVVVTQLFCCCLPFTAVKCPALQVPPYAVSNSSNSTYTAVSEFSCPGGFQLVGSNITECLASGLWSASPPQCTALECSSPSVGPDIVIISSNLSFNGTVQLACKDGFSEVAGTLSGSILRCSAGLAWLSNTSFKCQGESLAQGGLLSAWLGDTHTDN